MGVKLVSASAGSVELVAPVTASNYTATMPAKTGTVMLDGPAFSATFSGVQSVTSNTLTKVTLNTETFDTNNNYDPTTNYRFTPTVAGYYQFSYGINGAANATTLQAVIAVLYKNGTAYSAGFVGGSYIYPTSSTESTSTGTILVYMNGSTDYAELYGKAIGTSPYFVQGFLTGSLVRGA